MTTDTTGTPRANQKGDPCPPWCTQDHSRPLIPGKPQYGASDHHWSDLGLHGPTMMTRLTQLSGDTKPEICLTTIYGQDPVFLRADQAEKLAGLVESAESRTELADLLRTAVAAAGEGR